MKKFHAKVTQQSALIS